MVVDELEPQGQGALQLAFEQLKKRLEKEGLFDDARKRPLPALPQRVGIVTSAQGAALRDMLKVLLRFPNVHVLVAPAPVQGAGSAQKVADGIRRLGGSGLVDVLIVGRGGGSLEDLWAFNEEPVARAIAACPIPVISGVGHQVDFTIADFVADVRAATPTHAAELVVSRLEEAARRLGEGEDRLARTLARHLSLSRHRLQALEGSSGLARLPQRVRLLAERLARVERLAPLRGAARSGQGRPAAGARPGGGRSAVAARRHSRGAAEKRDAPPPGTPGGPGGGRRVGSRPPQPQGGPRTRLLHHVGGGQARSAQGPGSGGARVRAAHHPGTGVAPFGGGTRRGRAQGAGEGGPSAGAL